jgi:small subunit ribosomal protein S1
MSSDPNERHQQPANRPEQADTNSAKGSPASPPASNADSSPANESAPQPSPDASGTSERPGRRILIGSQRDPHAYRPKPKRDWSPVEPKPGEGPSAAQDQSTRNAGPAARQDVSAGQAPPQEKPPADEPSVDATATQANASPAVEPSSGGTTEEAAGPSPAASPEIASSEGAPAQSGPSEPASPQDQSGQPTASGTVTVESAPPGLDDASQTPADPPGATAGSSPTDDDRSAEAGGTGGVADSETAAEIAAEAGDKAFPPTNLRRQLSPELEKEVEESLGDASLDDLLTGGDSVGDREALEPESRCTGRIVAIHREDVFLDLGRREQGTVPLKQFQEPPEIGQTLDVIVTRFNAAEGLYELMVPNAAVDVGDWSELEEGMTVEARVTGHNSGGLECEVNHIRGFIPASQIALYRVENFAEFVDQKLACIVTEANPQRRNLVLSRRAVMEREREEARQNLLNSLQVGEIREGVVRKILDFGAFVDIGGLDGLLHISQLGWGRVAHPSDVLSEGQQVKVKIEKIDTASGKIGLGYRDMLENPWENASRKYPPNSVVKGKVAKLMDFGAFVELEPGVEGLVHISELSHKHVWRVSDVVSEGDEVEVVVLSVDEDAQRIGLSMKNLQPDPRAAKKEKGEGETEREAEPLPKKLRNKQAKTLKGGIGKSAGGERFGLKW